MLVGGVEHAQRGDRLVDLGGVDVTPGFEVFNDDEKQLPLAMVAARARRSVKWIAGLVSRRSLPGAPDQPGRGALIGRPPRNASATPGSASRSRATPAKRLRPSAST